MHFWIVDLQRQTLADEMLRQYDERAFPQVVGAGLERQSNKPDAPLSARENLCDGMIDVGAVRLHDTRVHRKVDIVCFRHVSRSAEVLGQTRASEREAGFQ